MPHIYLFAAMDAETSEKLNEIDIFDFRARLCLPTVEVIISSSNLFPIPAAFVDKRQCDNLALHGS
jgi:hypothetical protein